MSLCARYPTIADLTAAFRRQEISPLEALEETLYQCGRLDGSLRAIVAFDESGARQAARDAERRYRSGEARALEGVPVTVKDLIDVRGLRTRYGTAFRREPEPALADATSVANLRAEGAVVFAKTRLLECAYGAVNPEDGPCHNPWDTHRTSGGSSSGAAASIAVGMGYGAIGTDTGGSIRIPAAYCGVAGLKPTYGRFSLDGVLPLSWSLDHLGPIARSVGDLRHLAAAIEGRGAWRAEAPPTIRLGRLRQFGRDPVEDGPRKAVEHALYALAEAGVQVVDVTVPGIEDVDPAQLIVVMAEASSVHRHWRYRADVCYAELTLQQIQAGELIPAADYLDALRVVSRVRFAAEQVLRDVDALVMPTVGMTAPAEDPPVVDAQMGAQETWFTAPWNATGHPAISLPLPELVEGMPVGLQLVSRFGADEHLLAVAERITGHLGSKARLAPLAG